MAFGAKVKLSVNKAGAKSFRNEIQRFVDDSTASNPIKIKNIKLELNKSQQSQLRKNIQNYLNTSGDNLTIKINRIDASGAVKQLRSQLETMLSGLSITGLKDFLGTDGVGSTYERAANAADKLAAAQENVRRKSEQVNASARVLQTLQNNANSAYTHGNKITDIEQVTKITNDYQLLCTQIEKTKNLEGEEQQTAIQGIAEKTAALRAYIDEIYKNQAASNRANAEELRNNQNIADNLQRINVLYKKLHSYSQANPKVMNDPFMGAQINEWTSRLISDKSLTNKDIKDIENGFAAIAIKAKEAGIEGETFGDKVAAAYKKFGGWTIITRTLTFAIQKLKEMISVVIEVDTAMTELRKVTDLTEQAYDKVFDRAISRAKTLGATVSDTITATADFARLGYTVNEAEELSNAAIIYKNVGDGIESISDASESIISTMKAFGIQANESMSIVDKFNEVGNNFAISSKGVGEALQRSASALAVAGNTIDESIALAVGMNAVVQDPEKVGTVLKTSSMYLRAAETDLEAAGEATDGMAKSVSELRAELLLLTNNKVDIMADDNTFKSTIQIYRELAAVWDELADVDAANILELIGGKRNATANASLLQNFDDVEKALASSTGAVGSATKENEKYLDSIQGKLSKLKATFEEFSANFISSDMVKMVVSLGTLLLSVLTALDKIHLLIPLLTLSVTALIARKKALQLAESTSLVNTLASSIIKEKAVTDTLATSVALLSTKEKALLVTQIEKAATSGAIDAGQKAQIVSTLGLTSAEGALTIANKGLAASFKSLLASIPVFGWIALGVSVALEAIPLLVDWIKSSSKSIEDLNSEWDELSNKINTTANDFKELNNSANDVIPRFAELAKGVDQFGKNVSLTDDEYAEFLSLNNKIAEMFPELNLGMDENGNAMLSLSYSANTLTDSLWSMIEAQRAAANEEIASKMPDTLKNIADTNDIYQKDIEKKKKILENWNNFAKETRGASYSPEDQFTESRMAKYDHVIEMANSLGLATEEIQKFIKYVDNNDGTGYYNWDELLDSSAVKNAVAGIEKEIDALQGKIQTKWKQLNPIVTAWIQTDIQYQDMGDEMQNLVANMLSNIDYDTLGIETEADIKKYISDNILSPIHDAAPEVQSAITSVFSLKNLFDKNEISVGEYKSIIDKLVSTLKEYGFNDNTIDLIKLSLNTEDFEKKLNYVKSLLAQDFKNNITALSANDIELAYKIKADANSLTFAELQSLINSLKASADSAGASLEKLSSVSEAISSLSGAFDEMNDSGYISIDTLSSIKEALGKNFESWDEYQDRLLKAKAGSAEFNNILSDLTYAILENKFGTDGLSQAKESQIAAILRENNVLNYNEIAHFVAIRAKETYRIKTALATATTAESIAVLATEAIQAGITGTAFENLVLDIGIFNNTSLSVADKIAALQELGYYASLSASQIANIGSIQKMSASDGSKMIVLRDKQGKIVGKEKLNTPDASEAPKIPTPRYRSSKKDKSADNAKKAADAKKDYAKKVKDINDDLAEKEKQFAENMEEAWKKEHLETLKDNLSERKDILDRYSKSLDILDSSLKLIDGNDFESQSTLLNQKMQQSTAYASALKDEFERVSQIIPQTGEEAQELADRLENLGSEMRSNTENMREALIEVTKLRFNMLSAIGESAFESLNREFDNLDKRIESLTSGDSYAYRHVNELMDYSTFLPTYSDFDRQRRKRQKQDNQLIADTKKTQDKINQVVSDALKKQSQENARAREKERQKLIEDMEKARQDAKEKLEEAKKDFDEKMSEIKDSAKEAITSVQDTLNNADFKTPKVDISDTLNSLDSVADAAEDSAKRVTAASKTAVDEWNKALSGRFDMGSGGDGNAAMNTSQRSGGSVPNVGTRVNMSGFDMSASNVNECVWFVRNRARTKLGKNTGIYGNASTWYGKAKASSHTRTPKADSIACFAQDSKKRGYGHVVYIEGVSGDTIYYTEGGQGYAKNGTQGVVKQAKRSDFESKLFGSFQGYIDLSAYAQGTPYHTGGLAMLGDEGKGKFEAAILPDNTVQIIGRNGAEIVDLPKGTRVLPHDQTKKAFGNGSSVDGKKIPMYADGTGGLDVSEERKNQLEEILGRFTYAIDWLNRRMDEELKDLESRNISNEEKAMSAYDIRRRYSDDASKISSELGKEVVDALREYESKTDSGEWIYDTETYNTILGGLQDITDTAYDFADAAAKAKSSVKDLLDDKLSTSQDWISQRNFYGDWKQYGDSELRAIQRMRKYVVDLYGQGMLSAEEFWKYEKELRQQEFTAGKDEFTNAVEAALDKAEKKIDERKEKLEFESSKYASNATLLQAYYDVINAVRDARNDINKEWRAAKAMYEYTNESTRKLLFNQGDFNALNAELNNIQLKANKLKSEYITAIQGAEKENLEEITEQYQRQYETLMKSYEIAKADLEIAKKKQKLENVLAEKNVKMFVNGRWIWAANTQDVINAQNELADAEYSRESANDTLMQDVKLNKLEIAQSSIATTINYLDSDLEKMRDNWEKIKSQFESGARSLGDILTDIANSSCPQLQNIFESAGDSIVKFVKKLTGEEVSLEKKPTKESKWQGKGSVIYENTGLPQGIGHGYATGTKHALSGLAKLAEKSNEVVITNEGEFVPIDLPSVAHLIGGETIFNHEMTERLWNLAKQPPDIASKLSSSGDTFSFTGDIIVQNPANAKEVADNVVGEIVQGLKLRRRTV